MIKNSNFHSENVLNAKILVLIGRGDLVTKSDLSQSGLVHISIINVVNNISLGQGLEGGKRRFLLSLTDFKNEPQAPKAPISVFCFRICAYSLSQESPLKGGYLV